MNAAIRMLALSMVLAFSLIGHARAQNVVVMPSTAEAGAFASSRGTILNAMALDLNALGERDWKRLARETERGLWSRDAENRMQALQNLLHVTRVYPGRLDFSGTEDRLCRLAKHDRKRSLRVMAVAALRAVDTPEAMGCLVDVSRSLQPAQVRKVVNFALADYVDAGVRPVRWAGAGF